jgi:predicted O-methyltransferase YrrM
MNAAHPFMIFIDGDHRFDPVMRYFNLILKYKRHDTVLIIDDIRWSAEMERAWQEIKMNPAVVITVDLFQMGLVFFREGVFKQDFMVNF